MDTTRRLKRTRDRSVIGRCRKLCRGHLIFYSVDSAVSGSHYCGFTKLKNLAHIESINLEPCACFRNFVHSVGNFYLDNI